MKKTLFLLSLLFSLGLQGQTSFTDSVGAWQKEYVATHGVVKEADRHKFSFFPADASWKVTARFEPAANNAPFPMESSGAVRKLYRRYGTLHFMRGTDSVVLTLYQSMSLMETEEYRHHLFLPFADATSGKESYSSGRYLDLDIRAIRNGQMTLDFNKAYNPYCAYVSGVYNCPIPPPENRLSIPVRAGERAFAGH